MNIFSMSNLRAGMIAAAVLVGPMVFSVQAQDRALVRVNIPFDFQNGSEQLKSGTYTISSLNENVALVRGSSTSGMAVIHLCEDREPAKGGNVVFHKYGDHYFISDVFISGNQNHLHLIKSKAERQAERALRENRSPVGTIAVLEWPN